jgi:RND superfamily putative drug exporter
MLRWLGNTVARFWPFVLAAWALLLGLSWSAAPDWEAVTQSGEVASLPADAPSRRSEQLFREAFPDQYACSNILVVVVRQGAELRDEDKQFIERVLAPQLKQATTQASAGEPIVARIRTLAEQGADVLLVSQDRQATLVVLELTTSFLDRRNDAVVAAIEDLVRRLRAQKQIPAGLAVEVTGIATAGRDLLQAEAQSIRAIERWTVVIVVVLLVLLYRAPLMALIPLATVYVAVQSALNVLALLAGAGMLALDRENRIFITVLAYGAGVDYCVFLLARYREELEGGAAPREAVAGAITHVGGAIVASAATVIGGIGTLAAARFGKVHQAGIVIPFALLLVLAAALTLSAALLRFTGRWAFWPQPLAQPARPGSSRAGVLGRLAARHVLPSVWEKLGPVLLRRPGWIWSTTVMALLPFVVIALLHYHDQVYNPMSGLPPDAPSVDANRTLEQHFPPGSVGPLFVLLKSAWIDFSEDKSLQAVARLTTRVLKHKDELGVDDVRSVAAPLGTSPAATEMLGYLPVSPQHFPAIARQRAVAHYVSHAGDWMLHATHMDVLLRVDPFARDAIRNLERIDDTLGIDLPASDYAFSGPTASARDLEVVKQGDQRRAEYLVPLVVLVLLLLVLRRVVVSVYLVLSVVFSYCATLGVTLVVFGLSHWGGYTALDWKVPILLFTILVAVGEDYNIFLVTRIKEEVGPHGPLRGITEALNRTGRVISSCGLIMAGTFATLLSGSLLAMRELGFALAFGILLDTLVVRPILVPTFLILLQSGRLGRLGQRHALAPEEAVDADGANPQYASVETISP